MTYIWGQQTEWREVVERDKVTWKENALINYEIEQQSGSFSSNKGEQQTHFSCTKN